MLPAPFFGEVPDDLGYAAAWLGPDVMRALMDMSRHQPFDDQVGTRHDRRYPAPPASAPTHTRDRGVEHAPCRGRLEHA
jgi:hypothetical protein